ncbi:sideroflexin [Stylonychia lemnae]|uniref:Sideroflexin n=1 Tax=Stylonychia lemnae TaxID=5949 RepID=A0A078B1Q3_STYLE|nr:sideroflexin [Stylonychia lemnae]|eukprot:CDW88434.1 sideroflexin [Stylonychia lemnae]
MQSNHAVAPELLNQQIPKLYEYSFQRNVYDQSTFYGRFMHFQRVVDPRNFFITKERIQQSKQMVENSRKQQAAQNNKPLLLSSQDYSQLARAAYIVGSSTSRDTGEEIPRLMRMCAFLPANIPILFGMLLSPPSVANTIFWQWFNQSFNAGLNYGNRNASSPYTTKDLAFGYSAAVGSSVTMALLLRKLFSNVSKNVTGAKFILVNSVVASIASGTAGFLNTFCMRKVEMTNGIEVFRDQDLTEKVGKSKVCAERAIMETATSRIFLSFACLMTPAVIFYAFERMGRTPSGSKAKIFFEAGVFTFSLMFALPASIALFPQIGVMKIDQVEQELRSINQDIKVLYYNKGL